MNKYIMKSPIYYAVSIQGCHDNNAWEEARILVVKAREMIWRCK